MKTIDGGVTAAKGFLAASTAAGIKYKDRKDMAMIYSQAPCKVAGRILPRRWSLTPESPMPAQAIRG